MARPVTDPALLAILNGDQPQGNVFTLPQDPAKAATTRGNQIDNEVKAATAADQIAKARADAARAQAEAAQAQADLARGGLTADQQSERRAKIAQFEALVGQINRVQELYNQSVGKTKGLKSLMDYVPTDANARFDAAGAALSQQGLGAFRIPGTGTVSDRDAIMFDRANLPTADTRDSAIEEQLRGLRERVAQEYASRGLPAPKFTGLEAPASRFDEVWGQRSTPRQTVAQGKQRTEYAPELSLKVDALMNAGATKEDIDAVLAANNFPPLDGSTYSAAKDWMAKNPGKPYFGANITRDVATSGFEQLAGSPIGSALIGAGNMTSFGSMQAIAPEAYQASQEANPVSGMLGSVGGAMLGTAGIGMAGRNTIGRLAPNLMGGGRGAAFGRNLATDATYGAGYGAVTEGDPLTGALVAGGASALGQGVGSAVGRAVGGVSSSPTVQRLRDLDITPTIGQIFRGRAADSGGRSVIAGIEDTIANTGIVGSTVNTARTRALEDANNAAFRLAGEGAPIQGFGQQALDQLDQVKTQAYSDALDGVSLPVNDPRFISQINAADNMGRAVDASRGRGDFGYVMDRELAPIVYGNQTLSGRQLQDALRLLQGQKTAYGKAASGPMPDPSANAVAGAFGKVEDAFTGLTARNAPDTIPALKKANRINRNLSVLDDAAGRAMNNEGVFTPAQLGEAMKTNSNRFGGNRGFRSQTKSPLFRLQQDMQAVLPNQVPPTGVNAAPMLALGGAAVTGAGQVTDSDTLKTAGLLGLLATPYTKAGQNVTARALLDRPQSLKALGAFIRKHKGLFGTSAVPLALEAGQ